MGFSMVKGQEKAMLFLLVHLAGWRLTVFEE